MSMSKLKVKLISPLEKVFLDREPFLCMDSGDMVALKNETLSFQIAYTAEESINGFGFGLLNFISAINEKIRVRKVSMIPAVYPAPPNCDDDYLSTTPGLFPDLLDEITGGNIPLLAGKWTALWVDVSIDGETPAGTYDIAFIITEKYSGETLSSLSAAVKVLDAVLPAQKLIHTEWFHADCLADYYGVEAFGEEHWRIIGNFVEEYAKHGINMILTPLFTPPLDTGVGQERTTVQLVDVTVRNGEYSFGFDKLRQWVGLCRQKGIEYFEMSHLYSQWGAKYAPKIMASVDGTNKRIFGWDTPAVLQEYGKFLRAFLPRLTAQLREMGIAERTYFHISDEPSLSQLDNYKSAKTQVADLLDGFHIIDALSDFEFYKTGAVPKPIPSTSHVKEFIEAGIEGLWTYYCGGGGRGSSRLMAMPSSRNRILAIQLYKYGIEGFLHWGFNFYNSVHSIRQINPFYETGNGYGFASGDAYLVYPGKGGRPLGSIRLMVLFHAMQDLRAYGLLESLAGKKRVMEIIEDGLSEPIGFAEYPRNPEYLIGLRRKLYAEIAVNSQG
jgi:hypothetical protein